jgi:hypothetical protein
MSIPLRDGDTSGVWRKTSKDQGQRPLPGISVAADEQGHESGHGGRRDFGRGFARGQSGSIGARLQPVSNGDQDLSAITPFNVGR